MGSSASSTNTVPDSPWTIRTWTLGDSTDFMQVTVRLLDQNGHALQGGGYTTGGNIQLLIDAAGAGVDVIGHNGVGDYLVFQGTPRRGERGPGLAEDPVSR